MINWALICAILMPNIGGWASTLTMKGQVKRPDGKAWYQLLRKPSWTPPGWLFGPAWFALYTSMGYASYLVYQESGFEDYSAISFALYGGQLVLNWMWTPIFFGLHRVGLALLHMLILDVAAVGCTVNFYMMTDTTAAYLMVPYLGWLAFATCLNYSIWKLNQSESDKKSFIDDDD